jgi:hypothetical protein
MPAYRTDTSGFPVLTSEDGTDQVAQDQPYSAKAPADIVIELPEGATVADARAELERHGLITPARGVPGFGAGA